MGTETPNLIHELDKKTGATREGSGEYLSFLGRRDRLPFMHDLKEVKHSIVERFKKKNMQVVEETCQNQNLKTKTTTTNHCN